MKNRLGESPSDSLHARTLFSARFVDDADLAGCRVLNIGCGNGCFEHHVLGRGVVSIVGTEVSPEDLATARAHLHDRRLSLRVGDARALPFGPESFDTVVAWEVIEHIPRRSDQERLAEVLRILKPGGSFYIPSTCRRLSIT